MESPGMTLPTELTIHGLYSFLGSAVYWPLPLVLWPVPFGLLFWAVFLWARASERKVLLPERPERNSNGPAVDFDKGSWPIINHGWRLVRFVALVIAFTTPPWVDGTARIALNGCGLLLMIGGALLRQHCIKMLGNHFTYKVKVADDSQIIQSGIYRWVRHPSYTGGMLYNLGLALALTNWQATALVVGVMIVMYAYRVRVEESALLKMHSVSYGNYMQSTKRFVPYVF
jgi:protein-S-isoprenylcysteine O-methyltransferase Ste14